MATINYDSRTATRRRQFDRMAGAGCVPGAAPYARHDRPVLHADVRVGGGVRRPDLPLRSAHRRFRARARCIPMRGTGWGRIPSAATSGAGSSTARASRSRSASARPRSARSFGVMHRSGLRLSVRLGRPGVPARHRHPAGPAAAGARADHDRGARAVAAERDHRDRDPPDPDGRPASSAPIRWRCASCRSSRPPSRSA